MKDRILLLYQNYFSSILARQKATAREDDCNEYHKKWRSLTTDILTKFKKSLADRISEL